MCDCELAICHTETFPTARATHTCRECGGTIGPGEKYQCFKGVWDGHGMTFKTCMGCHHARGEYCAEMTRDDCWPCFGALWHDIAEIGPGAREDFLARAK
jgi:hypothetical protein